MPHGSVGRARVACRERLSKARFKGAAQAIEFHKKAFGAEEAMRFPLPDGKTMHAEIRIGGAVVMLAARREAPQWHTLSPQTVGDTSGSIMLYVDDVDAVLKKAADAGATVTMPTADQFYGDRTDNLKDPFGHQWHVAGIVPQCTRRLQRMTTCRRRAQSYCGLVAGPGGLGLIVTPRLRSSSTITRALALPSAASLAVEVANASRAARIFVATCTCGCMFAVATLNCCCSRSSCTA
jgi:PhnB protein